MNKELSKCIRAAKQEAQKRDLEFPQHFQQELRGYNEKTVEKLLKVVPDYRIIITKIEAFNIYHGWQPVHFDGNNTDKVLSKWPVGLSIPEIEALLDGEGDLSITMDPVWEKRIIKVLPIQMEIRHSVDRHSLRTILIKVETSLNDWLDENDITLNINLNDTTKNNEGMQGNKNILLGGNIPNITGDNNIIITEPSMINRPGLTIGEDAKGDPTSIVIGNKASTTTKTAEAIRAVGDTVKKVGKGISTATPSLKKLVGNSEDEDDENS